MAGGDPRFPQPEPAQPGGPLPGRAPAGRPHPPRIGPAGSGGRLQPARPSGPRRQAGAGQPGGGLPELEGGRDHRPGRRGLRRHPPPSPRKTFPCPPLHRPWRLRPGAGRRRALLRTAGRPARAGDRPVPGHVPQGLQDAGAGLPQRLRHGPRRQQRREPFLRSGRSPGARRPAGRGRHAVSHLRPGGDRVQRGVLPAARDRRSRGRLGGRRAAGDPGRGSRHPRMGHARALPPGAGWDRVPVPGERRRRLRRPALAQGADGRSPGGAPGGPLRAGVREAGRPVGGPARPRDRPAVRQLRERTERCPRDGGAPAQRPHAPELPFPQHLRQAGGRRLGLPLDVSGGRRGQRVQGPGHGRHRGERRRFDSPRAERSSAGWSFRRPWTGRGNSTSRWPDAIRRRLSSRSSPSICPGIRRRSRDRCRRRNPRRTPSRSR